MTTSELIDRLRELDPDGTMEVYYQTEDDYYETTQAHWVSIKVLQKDMDYAGRIYVIRGDSERNTSFQAVVL